MDLDQECKVKQEEFGGREAGGPEPYHQNEQSAAAAVEPQPQPEGAAAPGAAVLPLASRVKAEGSLELDDDALPEQGALPSAQAPSPDGGEGSRSSTGSEEILPDRRPAAHAHHGLGLGLDHGLDHGHGHGRALPLEKVDVGGLSLHQDADADADAEPATEPDPDPDPLELDEAAEGEAEAEAEPVAERKERATRLRRTAARQPALGALSEDSYDYSSSEEEEMRKTIMIGSAYQAVVPEGLTRYADRPYKQTDKLLWEPKAPLAGPGPDIDEYLQSAQQLADAAAAADGVDVLPMGAHVRDDEQALFLLMQCGHDAGEALRRQQAAPPGPAAPPPWTDEECRSFENGILTFGKDFHSIQAQRLRTRSVSEIVQFYYLWKKTERHDVFASKMRPEKKKYMLHPGLTLVVYELLDKESQKEVAPKDAITA